MSNIVEHHGPVVLVVLDGWGYRPERDGNAIAMASVPTWQRLWGRYPRTLLDASGLAVGLPEGQMGNSEVGHLNLGAGAIVNQDLTRIDIAIEDGSFAKNPALLDACAKAKTSGRLHLMGLVSDGGVHSQAYTLDTAAPSAPSVPDLAAGSDSGSSSSDNLTSATTALVQQTAAAAQSTATWGFNAGIQLDIDASKSKTNEKGTTAVASELSGNKIVIQTGTANADALLDFVKNYNGQGVARKYQWTPTGELTTNLIWIFKVQ